MVSARRGGGHSHWKVVRGCVTLKTTFFIRPQFSSGDPPFQALSSSRDPASIFWKKSCISRPIFAGCLTKFVAPETLILAKFCSGGSSLKPKRSVPETLFLKIWAAYTYPNFCWLYLPRGCQFPTFYITRLDYQYKIKRCFQSSMKQACISYKLGLAGGGGRRAGWGDLIRQPVIQPYVKLIHHAKRLYHFTAKSLCLITFQ